MLDDHGIQRWRAEVPRDVYAPDEFPDGAWVAMSEHHVVMLAPEQKLVAWDAESGKRVG